VETTCLNRDLPYRLSWRQGQSGLRLTTGAPVSRIESVSRRPHAHPSASSETRRRLAIDLTPLAEPSVVDRRERRADALREILTLYDFADSGETRAMIEGILSVRSRRVVGRVAGDLRGGFCRGVEVTLHFDEDRFAGAGSSSSPPSSSGSSVCTAP